MKKLFNSISKRLGLQKLAQGVAVDGYKALWAQKPIFMVYLHGKYIVPMAMAMIQNDEAKKSRTIKKALAHKCGHTTVVRAALYAKYSNAKV